MKRTRSTERRTMREIYGERKREKAKKRYLNMF